MVLTLFKHEVARTWRLLLAVIAVPVILTLVMAGLVVLDLPVMSDLAIALGTLSASLVMAGAQILLIWDYWRSSYSSAGYLTHSIPVSGRTIFGVKFVWACLVLTVAALGTLLLVGLLALATWLREGVYPSALFDVLRDGWAQATAMTPAWLWFAAIAFLVASVALSLIQFHVAISVGYESRLARLGHVGPVVVYLVLSMVLQGVFLVGFLAFPFGLAFGGGQMQVQSLSLTQLFADNNEVMPLGFFPVMLLVTLGLIWRTSASWKSRISLR